MLKIHIKFMFCEEILIFLQRFLQYSTHICTISLKNIKTNLKIRTKSSDWKFYKIKSWI